MKELYDPELLGLQIAKTVGNEYLVFCPFHNDSNPSAEYNVEKGLFYCFGCQESRTAWQLADELGGSMVPLRTSHERRPIKGGDDLEWINLLKNPLAIDNTYLVDRGVCNPQVTRYKIRHNSDGIIFPLQNKFGEVIGAQIRHYTKKPKYLFYGKRPPVWPMINMYNPHPLFITEGAFGVLRAEWISISAVAMMGAGSVVRAAQFVKTYGGRETYAVMDSDYAGLLAAGKFVLLGVPAIITPFTEDPDEWNIDKWYDVANFTNKYMTKDVNEIIAISDKPNKLHRTLEKFWRKL